jgi:hypothetical protein
MGYDIRAWLDRDGRPQLQIIDIDSGRIRVDWDCGGERSHAIKSLFHELILLSVRSDIQGTQARR